MLSTTQGYMSCRRAVHAKEDKLEAGTEFTLINIGAKGFQLEIAQEGLKGTFVLSKKDMLELIVLLEEGTE